ncbi:MAG: carboxymuconolactone decarboxylase family protein [Gammaproteobacteria bacterium]
MKFPLYTEENAPDASRPLLEKSQQAFGMIPNLHAVMAAAPAVLEAYQQLNQLFQQTSFSAEELTVVWQTINVEHECHYCVPAHTAIAHMMQVDPAITNALREGRAMPDEKLQVLHLTTLALVRKRGRLSEEELQRFQAAGYGPQQLLEIILGISQKVMSNYINHLAGTPVDAPFKDFAWTP